MFRFMMKLFDAIVFAISLLRTAERFIDSPDLHERLAAKIHVYVKRHEKIAGWKSDGSARADSTEVIPVREATMSYLDAIDFLSKGKKLTYERKAESKAKRSASIERTEGLAVLDSEVLSH